jgi:GAF domain-containing protein
LAYAWVGRGERGDLACSSADFFERFPYAAQTLRAGRPMVYGGLDEIPRQAQDERCYLASIGLLAAIAQPVMVDARLVAVLFIHRFTETQWPRDLIDRLPQVASIFSNALARRQAEAQLQAQLRFETLLAEISARFVNPSPPRLLRSNTTLGSTTGPAAAGARRDHRQRATAQARRGGTAGS